MNKLMRLQISIDCFAISIDCFGLSRIKKWMILIITVNLSSGSSKMRRQTVCSAEHERINLGQQGNLSARVVSG